MRFKTGLAACLTTTLLAAASLAHAQAWPTKTVRMIAPYASGGSSSNAALALAQKFGELAGQPMIVDYRPGAATNVGSDMVVRAAPDGYTVLMGTSSLAINPHLYAKMPFDPFKDLAPVTILFRTPNVLGVNPALPIRNVKELIDYARANPGKLNYGSSGAGASNHMAMELLKSMAKIDMVHIPFKGGGEAMPALISNEIQVMFSPASTLMPHDRTGRVRVIAVSGAKRSDGLNLPTVAESGLPGFESAVWFGLFAPAATPPAVIARLNAEVNRVLRDRAVLEVLAKGGLEAVGGPPEDMRRLLAADSERLGAVIRTAGIKGE